MDTTHPSADISSLTSGATGNPALEVEQLPRNGVLWNLDRIVRPFSPLSRACPPAPFFVKCCLRQQCFPHLMALISRDTV